MDDTMSFLRERKNEHPRTRQFNDGVDPDEVLTFKEWVQLNKLSERTGRRILGAPGGPVVTLLSARRFGITRRHNREWQASRERA
jgi:hypothetical protein